VKKSAEAPIGALALSSSIHWEAVEREARPDDPHAHQHVRDEITDDRPRDEHE
jgi:hypothetical protein